MRMLLDQLFIHFHCRDFMNFSSFYSSILHMNYKNWFNYHKIMVKIAKNYVIFMKITIKLTMYVESVKFQSKLPEIQPFCC